MPELPDVETYRRFLDATARRKQIRRVHVADDRIINGTNQGGLTNRLKNRAPTHTRRHGKYLLIKFGADQWLAVHFGMTGDLAYYKHQDNAWNAPPAGSAANKYSSEHSSGRGAYLCETHQEKEQQ